MNVRDARALHAYQRLATTLATTLAAAAAAADNDSGGNQDKEDHTAETNTANCLRLIGLLDIEEKRREERAASSQARSSASHGDAMTPEATNRLKTHFLGQLATLEARNEEQKRAKVLSLPALTERRNHHHPNHGSEAPLFRCPPTALSVETLLASAHTPWLHSILIAPSSISSPLHQIDALQLATVGLSSSTTITSSSLKTTTTSTSSSSSSSSLPASSSAQQYLARPGNHRLPGKSPGSATATATATATGTGTGTSTSTARRRQINYGRNRYDHRHDDPNSSPDDEMLDPEVEEENERKSKDSFISARDKLEKDDKTKGITRSGGTANNAQHNARPSGLRGSKRAFNPPFKDKDDGRGQRKKSRREDEEEERKASESNPLLDELLANEKLKFIDPIMVERIVSEILDHSPAVEWDDIAGLAFAKKCVKEAVVLPLLRPDFFRGIRAPPKGILLFGPPGTGKTMIGKAIASQSGARFFNISASSLTSKWIGEGEKTVRALFAVARCLQPAVIFIDEIDSILTQRSENDQEATRRLKTEFLIQLDGAACSGDDKLLVVGATNRPAEIDEAARRRLVKRLYIPLPDIPARKSMILHYIRSLQKSLTEEEIDAVVARAQGYSGSDIKALCAEAAMGPIRNIEPELLMNLSEDQIRALSYEDFVSAFDHVRPSVSQKDLASLQEWNEQFGSFKTTGEEALEETLQGSS